MSLVTKSQSIAELAFDIEQKENRHRMGLQPWYPGCGGTVPMDSDEPDFELTNGDELFNG
jgi:hypothetical protein